MFSDSNDDENNNNSSNPNIEWKKKGFDNNEKSSRRIDTKKAEEATFKDLIAQWFLQTCQKGSSSFAKKLSKVFMMKKAKMSLKHFKLF